MASEQEPSVVPGNEAEEALGEGGFWCFLFSISCLKFYIWNV